MCERLYDKSKDQLEIHRWKELLFKAFVLLITRFCRRSQEGIDSIFDSIDR